jgi:tetratricopeptide (TPR) repeat protein
MIFVQFGRYRINENGQYSMIKKLIGVIGISCFTSLSYAQTADSAAYFLQKGIEEKNARRFREAEKNFVKADQVSPGKLSILLELADAYTQQNRYAEAKVVYDKAAKIDANNPVVVENLATLSFNLRKWQDAINYAQKVQQLKINKPVNFIIGKSYYEMENYGEAIKFLNSAAREEPTRAEIPYIIARSYLDMSNYKRSAAQL